MVIIYEILLYIDGIIYGFIDGVYDIFDFLARINLFGEDKYNDIVGRIYIVLGVLMLFVLAYTLLRAIINPDEFSKGDSSFANLAKNIVVSLIIIVMLPTVFAVAFNIQDAILNTGTITKLVLGNMEEKYVEVYDDKKIEMTPGRMLAVNSFGSFFYPNPEFCEKELQVPVDGREAIEKCKDKIHSEVLIFFKSSKTLREVDASVKAGDISMRNYAKFGKAVKDDQITYSALISTAAGVFLLYVLLNFVFDMALRVIKLMFYQIIAPIPVICRIIPFGGFKDVFKNWLKQVTGVFFEVFVRIGIMNFGILLIKLTFEAFNDNYRHGVLAIGRANYSLGWLQFTLARILIVMGIVMFIRKAPELLSKLFGIDTGGMKLGLREKLAQGGAFTAGAAIGAAGGMAIRNAAHGVQNVRRNYRENGVGAAIGAGIRGLGSTIAGTVSGGVRGLYRGRNAQNRQDMRTARSGAIDNATRARDQRENYRSTHRDTNQAHNAFRRWATTNLNVAGGHLLDTGDNIVNWMGDSVDQHQDERRVYDQINRYRGNIENLSDEIRDRSGDNSGLLDAVMENHRQSTINKALESRRNEYEGAAAEAAALAHLSTTLSNWSTMSAAQQQVEVETYLNSKRDDVVMQAELDWEDEKRKKYGDAKNLDDVRRRVQRLQDTTFVANQSDSVGNYMEVDGMKIRSQQEFDDYVARASHALNDFERDSSTVVRQSIMNGQQFYDRYGADLAGLADSDFDDLSVEDLGKRLDSQVYSAGMTYNGRTFNSEEEWKEYAEGLKSFKNLTSKGMGWYQVRTDPSTGRKSYEISASGGVRDRIESVHSNAQSLDQTFDENRNLANRFIPGATIHRNAFNRMDEAGHAISRRIAEINVENEHSERRRAARGGNNNGNNNGH